MQIGYEQIQNQQQQSGSEADQTEEQGSGERSDQAATAVAVRERLLQRIRDWRQDCGDGGDGRDWQDLGERVRRQLAELGYA